MVWWCCRIWPWEALHLFSQKLYGVLVRYSSCRASSFRRIEQDAILDPWHLGFLARGFTSDGSSESSGEAVQGGHTILKDLPTNHDFAATD